MNEKTKKIIDNEIWVYLETITDLNRLAVISQIAKEKFNEIKGVIE
jgi:hypothetical protein